MTGRGRVPARVLAGVGHSVPRPGASGRSAACSGATRVTWPSVNPVWDFCWPRPASLSAGANGSGHRPLRRPLQRDARDPRTGAHSDTEREVRQRGQHRRDAEARTSATGTGCTASRMFDARLPGRERSGGQLHERLGDQCTGTTTPATTVCEGVHRFAQRRDATTSATSPGWPSRASGPSLKLTAQAEAGWYRYIPVWEFFADGTNRGAVRRDVDRRTRASRSPTSTTRTSASTWTSTAATGNYVDEVLSGEHAPYA